MSDAIKYAQSRLDALASDWSHGKPDQSNVERYAMQAAKEASAKYRVSLAVTFDEFGNPEFKADNEKHFDATSRRLARMQFAITKEHLSPAELFRVANGVNPHDLIDYNICRYGAWAAIFFDEMDPANQEQADLANAADALCLEMIRAEYKESK